MNAANGFSALAPGGWFEAGSLIAVPIGCDDGSLPKDSHLHRWHDLLIEAAEKMGRPLTGLAACTDKMKEVGFVNMKHKDYKWPLNSWPKDEHLREIGRWHCVNIDLGLEGLSMGLLTRVLGWGKAEVEVFCANVRKDLRNKNFHAYWRMYVARCMLLICCLRTEARLLTIPVAFSMLRSRSNAETPSNVTAKRLDMKVGGFQMDMYGWLLNQEYIRTTRVHREHSISDECYASPSFWWFQPRSLVTTLGSCLQHGSAKPTSASRKNSCPL